MKAKTLLGIAVSALLALTLAQGAMGAYQAHRNDQDVNRFLGVYPFTGPTKLNDCSLCHPGGQVGKNTYGSCDYCHEVYGLEAPHGPIPLNAFGADYNDEGRTSQALRDIEGDDSDGDGHKNVDEINALSFPGDENDYPGLIPAPSVTLRKKQVKDLVPAHEQFLLLNTTRQGDFYAQYKGAKIKDLLESVGMLPEATHITVFAPDGFSKQFPIEDPTGYDVMGPYPKGYYFGNLDFVEYPAQPVYSYGEQIPDNLHMLLAYLRQGGPLEKGRLEMSEGRMALEGEGPFRLVVPQKVAGSPDRSVKDAPLGDIWDYDDAKDHNAGFCVRSVTAIRVEPLPDGTTDFNWFEGGWGMVNNNEVVIYGAIDPSSYPVTGEISKADGSPLADVQVSFGIAGSTASDAGGHFQKNLPLGKYTMVPSKPGYAFKPENVTFTLKKKGFSKDFVGYTAQTISGEVMTSHGTPVPNVKVKLKKKMKCTTDVDGQYLQSVTAGKYTLKPKATGFRFEPKKLKVNCTGDDVTDADFMAVDKKKPEIKITSPKKNYKTGDDKVDVSGTATDNFMVMEVTWTNGSYDSGTATGTDNWTASVKLKEGKNKIVFTAVDEEGNAKSKKLEVTMK